MIPWVKRLGLATILSMALSISDANSREFSSKRYANELLESIGGSTNGWTSLLVLLQDRPNGPGPNREKQDPPRDNRDNRRPPIINPGDNAQQKEMEENRERQRQAEMQRQAARDDARRAQENHDRETRERNNQRDRFAQEAQKLEGAMRDHQRALQEISARLEEIRKRMGENQGEPGPRKENQFFRPNPQQQGLEPFRGERKDQQLEEVLRRFDRQMDKQNAQIRELEEQVRELRNRDQRRQPGNEQLQGMMQNHPQILLIPVHQGWMGQSGNSGPSLLKPGFTPVPPNHGPNQGVPFNPNPSPQYTQPSHDPHSQASPNHAPIAPSQIYPPTVPNRNAAPAQYYPPNGPVPPRAPAPGTIPPHPPANPMGPNPPQQGTGSM